MGFKTWATVATISTFAAIYTQAATKVACVGNSITEGYGIWDKKKYPEHLQDMLGDQYEVKNFGHSGQMFRKNSGESYWNSAKFTAAYEYAPDIVVIELGTNDSKYFYDGTGSTSGYNYMYDPSVKSELLPDYEALIDTFAHQTQAPKIYATLQPYAQNTEWGIVDTAIVNQINPIIKEAATAKGAQLIDLHSTFNKTEWLLDDVVHPNEEGAKELAQIIANGILGKSAESSSSGAAQNASSSTSTNTESSSSIAADTSSTTALHFISMAEPRVSIARKSVAVDNYIGAVLVFDINGNLVKQAHSTGSIQIQMVHSGIYFVKTGAGIQKIQIK